MSRKLRRSMDKKYCLYMHISHDGRKYIGKTCQPPVNRWQRGYDQNKDFFAAILCYGGKQHFLYSFEHCFLSPDGSWVKWEPGMSYEETNCFSQEEAAVLEKQWIKNFETMNPEKGFNRVSGGDRGFEHAPISKERNRQAHKGLYEGEKNPAYGMRHTPETKKLLSELASQRTGDKNSFWEKRHSKETKEKNRQAHLGLYDGNKNPFWGKTHSLDTRKQIGEKTRKPVAQFDLAGNFVCYYPSLSAASNVVGVSIQAICDNCRGKTKQCANSVFRYAKKYNQS